MRGSGGTASLSAEWPQRRRRRCIRPTVCSAAQPAPSVWAQCLSSRCHHRLGSGVRCGCLRDISRTSSAARFQRHDQIGVRGQPVRRGSATAPPRPRCPARPGMGRHGSVRRPNPVASLPDGVATRTERTGDPPPRSTIPLATWNTSATAHRCGPVVSESSWGRTEAATEELINSAPCLVKPPAIMLRCDGPAMVPPPCSTAGLCASVSR